MTQDPRITLLQSLIRDIPDFPKPGILFKDITPLIGSAEGLAATIGLLVERTRGLGATKIVAPESRGFIFGVPLAHALGVGFAPIRKPGKLPWRKIEAAYALEYGTDMVQMHADAVHASDRVLIVDDLLATGGTMGACCKLVEEAGAKVAGLSFVVELRFLNGRARLPGRAISSLVTY
jgi:adenine phosphoribosyltransferase